ncbi:DUF2249 domain-containing protein [Flavihumibacter solisilvae]|uniref:DUF2249 domain-containing protein n=1 Tax=Flavihumibacter solisilvae TaxID=1349421 RepID=A0A0C1IXF4_9BACT|nr:DUF2249 domain-containing protein [Flavihumibacter solisilvae]KIC95129.1 hypothetical protein OI18_07335 [Flavihumibacter solisilvae]
MRINGHTKIAALLKAHPGALDAIVSVSPKFEKLRNPVLRKLMAGRTNITMACKVAGCSITEFYEKLSLLGFDIEAGASSDLRGNEEIPAFVRTISKENIIEIDVRKILEKGEDPLSLISRHTLNLRPGQLLKIVNSFYPEPLVSLLDKQGFGSFFTEINEDLVETFFYVRCKEERNTLNQPRESNLKWDEVLQIYSGRTKTIDVRNLEMPLPMITILEALDELPADQALFVYHKRLPVYLLPELASRNFRYSVNEVREGELNLLIYR